MKSPGVTAIAATLMMSACTNFNGARAHTRPTSESDKSGSTSSTPTAHSTPAPESAPNGETKPVAKTTPDIRHQSLSVLERAEMERPADSELKLELGRRQWCAGRRGPAVENWLWVRQFGLANSKPALEARERMAIARKTPDALEDRLECGDIRDEERK